MPLRLILLPLLLGCAASAPAGGPAFDLNRQLARSINFGNMLEAPNEGDWGLTMQESYFQAVQDAGFTAIRLPIKWSAHAAATAPYALDPTFAARIDWAIEQSLSRKLAIILDFHHYDELYAQPEAHEARFLAIWTQIAERYRDQPESVLFEVLNEPHDPLTADKLNRLYVKVLPVIRATNPTRGVIVGPTQWNSIDKLPTLELPADDRLIVTFHSYEPHHFTHQGASWAEGSDAWLGQTWGTAADQAKVRAEFEAAATWARQHNRPLFLGEFGVYERADLPSRIRWTRFIRSEAQRLGMSWGYWEFAAGFGVYDPQANEYRQPLLGALLEE